MIIITKLISIYSRQNFHPPIHQFHRPLSQQQGQRCDMSTDRNSVGQVSETVEFNDDRKISMPGNS
jgi:hypothetical protein